MSEVNILRYRIEIKGIVQGVGFRPFVYKLALRNNLAGFVYNDTRGVVVEIEGIAYYTGKFHTELKSELPSVARIDSLKSQKIPTIDEKKFVIRTSEQTSERNVLISPDIATCDDCIEEMFDPDDRRFRYPFINCTNCGPRFTIITDVPYDRKNTTMKPFIMCQDCQSEFESPTNRRFHAQPNACGVCGPTVEYRTFQDTPPCTNEKAIQMTAKKLCDGGIVAIKGLGGYHLACDARNSTAVQTLRTRKHRDDKPFALMVGDIGITDSLCWVSDSELKLLQSSARPIVLLKKKKGIEIPENVAPGNNCLGIMLPYTPIHHLIFDAFTKIADKSNVVLVMTSANLSAEPIIYNDFDVEHRLRNVADGYLTNNRPIQTRNDDSVLRIGSFGTQFIRRSRGFVPLPITLKTTMSVPILACGGQLKNTFCLGSEDKAFLSHHIGDLENHKVFDSFHESINHYTCLLDIQPEAIVHDLHPGYLATKYVQDSDISPKIEVQHHHAHIASVMAEHDLTQPVIGFAADGTGLGTDGAIWGSEVMIADLNGFSRIGHLSYIPLLGGDMAIRQPWRMACAYLSKAYNGSFLDLDFPFVKSINPEEWEIMSIMLEKNLNSPNTSSMGRLFDAVAALIGLRKEVKHEGQAATELENIAKVVNGKKDILFEQPYHFNINENLGAFQIEVFQMIRSIVDDLILGVPSGQISCKFHSTIAEIICQSCVKAREKNGINIVALSGGVFQNRLVLNTSIARLIKNNFRVYTNRNVPPNDGGLSLGQIAIASSKLSKL